MLQCTEELKTSLGQESDRLQHASQSEGMKQNSDELLVHGCHGRDKMEDQTSEFMPSVSSGIRDSVSTSCFQGLKSTNQAKNELCQSGGTSESIGKYRAQSNVPSVANPKKKSSRFEAAAAEAELDMLLDSFSETRLSDSSVLTKKSSYAFSDQQETSSRFEGNSFLKQAPSRKEPDLSKPTSLSANFDDALDDLLNNTSSGVAFSVPQEGTSTPLLSGAPSLRSAPAPKSKALDDFDSWFDTV